jgi:hypothetical protein
MLRKGLAVSVVVSVAAVITWTGAAIGGGTALGSGLSLAAHGSHAASGRLTVAQVSRTSHLVVAAGRVTDVNAVATTGHCGTNRSTGTFVLDNETTAKRMTVVVTHTTRFLAELPGMTPLPSHGTFSVVCVGKSVSVAGTTTAGVVSANTVMVIPPGRFRPE